MKISITTRYNSFNIQNKMVSYPIKKLLIFITFTLQNSFNLLDIRIGDFYDDQFKFSGQLNVNVNCHLLSLKRRNQLSV